MYRPILLSLALALIAAGVPCATAGMDAGDYLTDAGQLKEVLEVKAVQGGFAGFTGWLWKVEKDGAWKKFQVFNQKLTEKDGGKLDKAQLTALAKELAKYNAANLKNAGKPETNQQVVTIQFGKQKAELIWGPGEPLPKGNPATVEGRYGGITEAVQKLLKGTNGAEK